ncbi:glutathione S-transferase family protein [Dyella sp.]|jgi:glutathione S-transferase|uniref:glutathione S-transferase family protein n=1 Tax=Dyella sp. TaxID=1869338 RepID=UPI002D76ED24|nr:glutathione S-transferase family protein [Dyella sp.]HET6433424.1 glutathione S-transferase family protein [Dyella sp.]
MITLHIANKNYSSWSLRPWLLLSELGVPFEERLHVFGEGSNWSTFRAFSPNGRVPCLHDGDTVVWDSLAIAEYIAELYPAWPEEAPARHWARSAAAEMHAGFGALRQQCSMSCGLRVRLHEIGPALAADVARIDELWSEGLQRFGGPFLAGGRFTAVDAFYAPVAFRVQTYGLPLGPAAAAYGERLLELTSMRRWYASALAEPWRDEGHDRDVASVGTVTADLRDH